MAHTIREKQQLLNPRTPYSRAEVHGHQRTDSPHVLAATRTLNRL